MNEGMSVCMYVCMSLCMYVCMYVCLYVCMYVYMYVCMYVCTYVFTYVCMYECMYVRMYVCRSVSMYVCLSVCICMFVCVYVCLFVCSHCYLACLHMRMSSQESAPSGRPASLWAVNGRLGTARGCEETALWLFPRWWFWLCWVLTFTEHWKSNIENFMESKFGNQFWEPKAGKITKYKINRLTLYIVLNWTSNYRFPKLGEEKEK